MAKPRVFISSTYYDLKHLRSAFESFLEQFGFEPVLSEKGSIAYAPDVPLDESCYREVEQVDIFVLIIGGRYGTERSFGESKKEKQDKNAFYERYDSITREEFRAAIKNNIPTYVLIERAVYAEYHTFTKNRESHDVNYAHVDSVNIFKMIDEIASLPRNNPIFSFEKYHEIEIWLREQWASLFKELLRRTTSQEQLSSLAEQVSQLTETNKTLRTYIESLMTHVAPDSQKLISSEAKRLKEIRSLRRIKDNVLVKYLTNKDFDLDEIGELIIEATSVKQFLVKLEEVVRSRKELPKDSNAQGLLDSIEIATKNEPSTLLGYVNEAREILGLYTLDWNVRKREKEMPKSE